MELRALRYFLAIAEEGSFTKAANKLNLTQPTLSRQIQELELELGKPLFDRSGRHIRLTSDGIYFKCKAGEILHLSEKVLADLQGDTNSVAGNVYIGCGETRTMEFIADVILRVQTRYPDIVVHFSSGNAEDVRERLENGLVDFGLFVMPTNLANLEFLTLPHRDQWGILMRKDCPLAVKTFIEPGDLSGQNLICSRQSLVENEFAGWFGDNLKDIKIVATYNLLFNATLLVKAKIGLALGLDGIINTAGSSSLTFRPLKPALNVNLIWAWKSNPVFSKPALVFKKYLEVMLEAASNDANIATPG